MIFLPIADRELRTASRSRRFYRARLAMAAVCVLIFGWMVFIFRSTRWLNGPDTFHTFAWLAFVYCLLAGANITADSLSGEKRENTLGLLFLTDLKGYDILVGKLLGTSLSCFFGLLAMFPVLAIPLIMGGVQFTEFWQVSVGLINTLFLSVSVGLFVSSVSRNSFTAIAVANVIMLYLGFGHYGLCELLRINHYPVGLVQGLASISPFFTQMTAMQFSWTAAASYYWTSLLATNLLALVFLTMTSRVLPRIWQDKPGTVKTLRWRDRWRRWKYGNSVVTHSFRTRLLEFNPFYWLACRERISSLSVLAFLLVIAGIAVWVGRKLGPLMLGPATPMAGLVFIWAWAVAAMHIVLFFKIATAASYRFAADRESGALELLLSTPLPVRRILRGQWLAVLRQITGPILMVLLAHTLFFWGLLNLFLVDEKLAISPWQLLKMVVLAVGPGIRDVDWGFLIVVRVMLTILLILAINWIALTWVSMWIGLRARRPRFAPWIAFAVTFIPPGPVFILTVIVMSELDVMRPEFEFVTRCMKVGLAEVITYGAAISAWSWFHLRWKFRRTATDKFQVVEKGRGRRLVRRVALATALVAILVTAFYHEERWRGRRAWTRFERATAAKGLNLTFRSIIPPEVPDEQNFGKAPLFAPLFGTNAATRAKSRIRIAASVPPAQAAQIAALQMRQAGQSELDQLLAIQISSLASNNLRGIQAPNVQWVSSQTNDFRKWNDYFLGTTNSTNLSQVQAATSVLNVLAAYEPQFEELREAARRPANRFPLRYAEPFFNVQPHLEVLNHLAELLKLRACASLAVGNPAEALQDIQLILRLSNSIRQEPFLTSQQQRLSLLSFYLQPIWEGLANRQWTSQQLDVLRAALSQFDLLSEYQTTMRNETIVQAAFWDEVLAVALGEKQINHWFRRSFWQWVRLVYPSGWAYQNKLAIHQKLEKEIAPLCDPVNQRVALIDSPRRYGYSGGNINPTMSGFERTAETYALWQSWVNLANVACALEQYRLAHGSFPETTDKLVPKFLKKLPHDLYDGQPLRYRRTSDSEFLLYAIGENRKDDQGRAYQDLAWRYPTK